MVTQTWTAPARGRVTVADWAARWLDSQTGIKPSTLYLYGTLLGHTFYRRGRITGWLR